MRSSKDRILTTHAGSLSRPANLIAMGRAGAAGKNEDKAAYANCLADAVADVVRKQRELGIDIPDDGEFGKPVAGAYDYGAGGITPSLVCQDFRRRGALRPRRTKPCIRNRASPMWR